VVGSRRCRELRVGKDAEPASEIGTEILLYFTSAKEARYEMIAGTQYCEFVGSRNSSRRHVPAEVCKAKAPESVAWVRMFPADVPSGT